MSQDMNKIPGNGYSYMASTRTSRLTSFRGFVGQKLASAAGAYPSSAPYNSPRSGVISGEERQGWRSWAGEKARGIRDGLRGSPGGSDPSDENIETINLFPGWAARKYRKVPGDKAAPRPFEVEVFVSGYAISHKSRENISRSQRAFIRVAKGFASLPKLTSESQSSLVVPEQPQQLSKSTEELLSHIHLPPRPDEVPPDYDLNALDRQFRRATKGEDDSAHNYTPGSASTSTLNLRDSESPPSSASSSTDDLVSALKTAEKRTDEMCSSNPTTPLAAAADMTAETLRRMHANLEERLQPFWSSVLSNRTVRIHLFVSPHQEAFSPRNESEEHRPLSSVDVTTAVDGSFQARFVVDWDQLCHHPCALHIAFGEEVEEHTLAVVAELLKPQPLYAMDGANGAAPPAYTPYQSTRRLSSPTDASRPTTRCQMKIQITHSPLRVISDIDDTVKDSGVLQGARAVFHNVFVKDLSDCIVPGMGEWYTDMWKKGVRFHYVSNGPFEYVSVLNEFMPMSQLPPGSIKLRSFAGRSLFSGFFSAPASRKRAGVEDILKSFPDSRFFLIGDSGEQDMELYAELAAAYPDNVLAVFIRDVTTVEGVTDPLEDPTGHQAVEYNKAVAAAAALELGADGLVSSGVSVSPNQGVGAPMGSGSSSSTSSSGTGQKKKSYSISSIWRGAEGPGDNAYFTHSSNNGPGAQFSAEPENYHAPDEGATPKIGASPAMENATVQGALNATQQNPVNYRPVITEPPKMTAPLSMESILASAKAVHRPSLSTSSTASSLHSRPSSRAQRKGTVDSSASESDSDERYGGGISNPEYAGGVVDSYDVRRKARMRRSTMSLPGRLSLQTSGLSPEEKKRQELQMRVWRARFVMPEHVLLRVFREPRECVEAEEVMKREGW